jgi:hypothetical protein
MARHLNTPAALIRGSVASRSTPLPRLASKGLWGATPESRLKRFVRWLENAHVSATLSFLPYAETLRACLALEQLVLVSDGRAVGRGGVALLVHVVCQGRALPWAWLVRQGKTGHFPAARHVALVNQVPPLLPDGAKIVLLGDGECDGIDLYKTLEEAGWSYVCRTASA